jgi:hypothetical protein
MNSKPDHLFQIGTIVTLSSHPYFPDLNKTIQPVLSGEPQVLPPIMVITEMVKDGRNSFEENSGIQITDKSSYQCKCVWFSQKTHQFEEAIISSKILKQIPHSEEQLEDSIKVGQTVRFITVDHELGKKKSSFKKFGNLTEDKTITALLSFVSPLLEVIGTVRNDNKEPIFDKFNQRKRWFTEKLIKCKYYNFFSEKFSEIVLPVETLEIARKPNRDLLMTISKAIEEGKFLKALSPKATDNISTTTIIKPERINSRNGKYFVDCYNYLKNRTEEIPIDYEDVIKHDGDGVLINQFEIIEELFINELPSFNEIGQKIDFKTINKKNIDSLDEKKYWRIRYKSQNDDITERTIIKEKIFSSDIPLNKEDDIEDDSTKKIEYLKAKCLLRDADRYFRIDRIQNIKVLNLNVEVAKPKIDVSEMIEGLN